jgi:hypothetical protein
MVNHPYVQAPAYRKWRQAVGQTPPGAIDPVVSMKFRVSREDKVATAGSCFAQHIARRLCGRGFNNLVTETAHPLLPPALADRFNYGIYTARFGNIYTSRQLLQLVQRAYGRLQPADDIWRKDGRYFDPFRPAIQPDGFATEREYYLDRSQHFAAVRTAFETMDVLIFTLGLTECWASTIDGLVYPVCPGVLAGTYAPDTHTMLNLSVADIFADLQAVVSELRAVNPNFRLILTVSPVPMAATALDRHVLVSNTYSKSVLRVAAELLAQDPAVAYFPAYEIITSPSSRGQYYADDLRSVTPQGVEHVMRLFERHCTDGADVRETDHQTAEPGHFEKLSDMVTVLCEEEALDPTPRQRISASNGIV